ncbi:NADH-FMN oxidoreductase RutF, flavin reductase (DIM6/NTAB) family [Parafrankia irregularis]|uniref:NADH-FMN oxidoreductase RutF, flavin reductase (DIM6/NTAB) family n=1 Tax=Parafrankia irregularis TaxID=795642 RepID=A0A0S4QRT2_9ACTN|nr:MULTISPECIES: flavin reductase family protein [Parafrankia]MBE3204226.1 flavin reductase [Parafrankia sp. CH37]CUU57194.1 NADH-FMN oxidoreductase RutF, flavin reductase (DIM6/NTAB) family [Parafrankia irregularis]
MTSTALGAESELIDPAALRRVFRGHAAGVAIVTMPGPHGPVGFTATSVASLSADPPLLSFSVAITSSCTPALAAATGLVVHLLSDDQEELAARFATPGIDRFAEPTRWRTLPTGEPLLADAAVWLRTRIRSRLIAGDHHLVIAEIAETRVDSAAGLLAPLVYHNGRYGTVTAGRPRT